FTSRRRRLSDFVEAPLQFPAAGFEIPGIEFREIPRRKAKPAVDLVFPRCDAVLFAIPRLDSRGIMQGTVGQRRGTGARAQPQILGGCIDNQGGGQYDASQGNPRTHSHSAFPMHVPPSGTCFPMEYKIMPYRRLYLLEIPSAAFSGTGFRRRHPQKTK